MQSDGSDTLGNWTNAGRAIKNTDIVSYYTLGFHHVTRMEDWPIMPLLWKSFTLKPFNFFTHNPAIEVAPYTPKYEPEDETSSANSSTVGVKSFVAMMMVLAVALVA